MTTISFSPPSEPRLRLRPPGPAGSARTPLDGGWWPRSTDPVAELPGLVLALQEQALATGHRPVTHVLLPVGDWDSRPRRLRVEGPTDTRVVRLSWFETLPAGLLTAICADRRRVDLLTVPARTDRAEAMAAMELAAHVSNHLHTPDLLAALTTPVRVVDRTVIQAGVESDWESEGGRLREHAAAT